MNRKIFEAYIQIQRAPTLAPGDDDVADNLSAQKSIIVEQAVKDRGAGNRFRLTMRSVG
jgi:hypothetical protein